MTMSTQAKKATGKPTPQKLHSIFGLLIGRDFAGEIETGKTKSHFTFSPASATVANGKLELTGRFMVKSASGPARKAENVKATLLGTQGGLATAPTTPKGADAAMLGSITSVGLPATDATGVRGYVGVMYFKLSALNGPALGLPFDLGAVQLNGRLNPADDTARALQFWYSVAVRATHGEPAETNLVSRSVDEINQILMI
jgi:hypothetical protein